MCVKRVLRGLGRSPPRLRNQWSTMASFPSANQFGQPMVNQWSTECSQLVDHWLTRGESHLPGKMFRFFVECS